MCTLSMVGDHYSEKWQPVLPQILPIPDETYKNNPISRWEFEQLRREVEDMKALVERALQYDREHNEPDCQVEEKLEVLRKVAEFVGIDLDEVFNPKKSGPMTPAPVNDDNKWDKCYCIQDESNDWHKCPEHGVAK